MTTTLNDSFSRLPRRQFHWLMLQVVIRLSVIDFIACCSHLLLRVAHVVGRFIDPLLSGHLISLVARCHSMFKDAFKGSGRSGSKFCWRFASDSTLLKLSWTQWSEGLSADAPELSESATFMSAMFLCSNRYGHPCGGGLPPLAPLFILFSRRPCCPFGATTMKERSLLFSFLAAFLSAK